MIDEPSDFRFHAAYEVYSKIWALDPPFEVKKELNAMISLLSEKKLSYKDFYLKIGKYRREFTPDQRLRGRRRIQTQRKRDWRKKEARKKRDSGTKRDDLPLRNPLCLPRVSFYLVKRKFKSFSFLFLDTIKNELQD